jgi:hypothetical protein
MTKLNMAKLISKFYLVVNSIMVSWPKIDLPFII